MGGGSSTVKELRQRVSEYDKKIEKLAACNEYLRDENQELKNEVRELRYQVIALNKELKNVFYIAEEFNKFHTEQARAQKREQNLLLSHQLNQQMEFNRKMYNKYESQDYRAPALNKFTQEKVLKPSTVQYNNYQLSQTFNREVVRRP